MAMQEGTAEDGADRRGDDNCQRDDAVEPGTRRDEMRSDEFK